MLPRAIPMGEFMQWQQRPWAHWLALAAVFLFTLAATLFGLQVRAQITAALGVEGPDDGTVLNAEQVQAAVFEFRANRPEALEDLEVRLDGEDVSGEVILDGGVAQLQPRELQDGPHRLEVEIPGRFGFGPVVETRTFSVDATAPQVQVLEPEGPVPPTQPVTLRAEVDDPAAEVRVDGQTVEVTDGALTVTWPKPPQSPSVLRASDEVGNTSEQMVEIQLALPGAEGGPPVRGVHVTGSSWSDPAMRDRVFAMIAQGRINSVQLDLKDESGAVSYDSQVALARESDAVRPFYDLEEAVAELHERGARMVGRIVNFADPIFAGWAADTGQLDLLVQNPDGSPYAKYGGFTNFAHPTVQRYNIDLAEEAAAAGVDDILYDYVRRPDGAIHGMRFPGLEGSPEDEIVNFLVRSRERLDPHGARLGASVFGIAAKAPGDVAQDIPRMSEHVDYIAPMVYPSHWGPGEYGVEHPNGQPYDIVRRSLEDFRRAMEASDASLMVWLQDFSLGVPYGADEVRAQIQAAADAGVDDWLLWNPRSTYSTDGIDPLP